MSYFMVLTSFTLVLIVSSKSAVNVTSLLKTMKIDVDSNCGAMDPKNHDYLNYKLSGCYYNLHRNVTPKFENNAFTFESWSGCYISYRFCADVFLRELDECLTVTQKKYLSFNKASGQATLDYLCDQDEDLINYGFYQSFRPKFHKVCPWFAIRKQGKVCQKLRDYLEYIEIENFYNEESCQLQEHILRCDIETLRTCKLNTTYYYMWESGIAGLMATPCKIYVNTTMPVIIFVNGANILLSNLNVMLMTSFYLCFFITSREIFL